MPNSPQPRSRADVVALALIAFMLAALLAPALAASNAQADKTQCVSRIKDIAIALHNAHDVYKHFPLASTQSLDHPPGTVGETASGYGWLVRLLPFIEHQSIYQSIYQSSEKLGKAPFDPTVTGQIDKVERPAAAIPIREFVCPNFVGGPTVTDAAPEYAALPADARPAVTSYHATAGSHFMNTEGLGRMLTPEQIGKIAFEGDGVIVFPSEVGGKLTARGIGMRHIVDGTSKTLLFGESNEPAYAAWIDGQVTWLVSAWPGNPDVPTLLPGSSPMPTLGWTAEQLKNNQVTPGAQKGIDAKAEPPIYLPVGRWTGKAPRTWGASSNHPEGIGHAFADGRAEMLSRDIDPVVYLHLTTRSGYEVLPEGAIK